MLNDPHLPPLFSGYPVKAPDRAFATARAGAADGRFGAADFIWARNHATAECALVLEPDVDFGRALQMAPLMEVALAEALGAVCPPQVAVEFRWPGLILVNGGLAGRVCLGAPSKFRDPALQSQPPPWLVAGLSVDLRLPDTRREPGETAERTSLYEEGAGDVDRTRLLEALAPRMLAWIHTWQEDGFRPIHDQWLFLAEGRSTSVMIDGMPGRVMGRDEYAGLVFKPDGGPVRILPYHPHIVWDGEGDST